VEGDSRGPNVRIPPPLLYLIPLAGGLIVQHYFPIQLVSGVGAARIVDYVGAAEIFIGVFLIVWAVSTFKQLGTPVYPAHDARALAEAGPFTLTRNPMYLAFAIIYLGITFVANAFWPLLFLPEALVFTYLLVIRREERYLTREFGDAYVAYCARVRRWI
jgi:protein-S-isoprenylcysteine O-methyltransferase Ste14